MMNFKKNFFILNRVLPINTRKFHSEISILTNTKRKKHL